MKYTAAVITVSDKGSRGERVDTSGPAICEMVRAAGYDVVYTAIIPDEKDIIQKELIKCSDEKHVHLILTTGGTGFSPRDITPEATLAVIERETRGIPEAMRLASLKITPKGCLSRSVAGIRGGSLIVNLPGSKKASSENLEAVLGAIDHGLEMLMSAGSANCGEPAEPVKKPVPSMDAWLKEAKKDTDAGKVGMYLTHNGIVRETAKKLVRNQESDTKPVTGMIFSYDQKKVEAVIEETRNLDGIYYVRVWLNEGTLQVGDDIMYVLVGGDIRPHVLEGLNYLVGKIKSECVMETELY
ncbi:MAG: molybdenum cofactor synthesis domain-containing protein [Brotaphodocola sp.]